MLRNFADIGADDPVRPENRYYYIKKHMLRNLADVGEDASVRPKNKNY